MSQWCLFMDKVIESRIDGVWKKGGNREMSVEGGGCTCKMIILCPFICSSYLCF